MGKDLHRLWGLSRSGHYLTNVCHNLAAPAPCIPTALGKKYITPCTLQDLHGAPAATYRLQLLWPQYIELMMVSEEIHVFPFLL